MGSTEAHVVEKQIVADALQRPCASKLLIGLTTHNMEGSHLARRSDFLGPSLAIIRSDFDCLSDWHGYFVQGTDLVSFWEQVIVIPGLISFIFSGNAVRNGAESGPLSEADRVVQVIKVCESLIEEIIVERAHLSNQLVKVLQAMSWSWCQDELSREKSMI